MKRILEGKRYDTEKATLIGEGSHGWVQGGDHTAWEAGLYRTPRSGHYFLAGTGGPMTQFREKVEGLYSGGSRIIPMSRQDAFAWAQHHLPQEMVETEFGDLIEDA